MDNENPGSAQIAELQAEVAAERRAWKKLPLWLKKLPLGPTMKEVLGGIYEHDGKISRDLAIWEYMQEKEPLGLTAQRDWILTELEYHRTL